MQSYLGKRGDSYDRFLIRIREMYESINIVFQILSNLTAIDNNTNTSIGGKNDFFSFIGKLSYKNILQLS